MNHKKHPFHSLILSFYFFFTFFLLLFFSSKTAAFLQSDQEIKVILAHVDSPVGFEFFLRNELEAMGYNVMLFQIENEDFLNNELEIIAKKTGASAAVFVRKFAFMIDVWIVDKITGELIHRQRSVYREGKIDDSYLAMSIVELLRANLLEIEIAHREHFKSTPLKSVEEEIKLPLDEELPIERELPDIQNKGVYIMVTFSGLFLMNESYPLPALKLNIAKSLFKHTRLGLHSQFSLISLGKTSAQGKITIRTTDLGLGMWFNFLERMPIIMDFGAGALVRFTMISGSGGRDSLGREKMFPFTSPFLEGGFNVALNENFRFRFDITVGTLLQKLKIMSDEEKLGDIGYGWVSLGLGMLIVI